MSKFGGQYTHHHFDVVDGGAKLTIDFIRTTRPIYVEKTIPLMPFNRQQFWHVRVSLKLIENLPAINQAGS